jgi:signal transduction histidine kinase
VIGSLLANAIKFTPDKGRVMVRVTQEDNHAVIAVADTRRGIRGDFLPVVSDYPKLHTLSETARRSAFATNPSR